jgi:SAM-dependent methyltransferase
MPRRGLAETCLLDTHDVGIPLPKNTRYLLRNPVSHLLTRRFMATLVGLVQQVAPCSVLDVGCGEGMVLRQLEALGSRFVLHGLDVDVELLEVGKTIAPGARYLRGSIYHLPLPRQSYDLVVCTEVLEHLQAPEEALAELARVARRYCLLSVPHEPWWRMANMLRGKYWDRRGNTPGHINHWSAREFTRFVSERFRVVAVRRPFPWTFVLGEC